MILNTTAKKSIYVWPCLLFSVRSSRAAGTGLWLRGSQVLRASRSLLHMVLVPWFLWSESVTDNQILQRHLFTPTEVVNFNSSKRPVFLYAQLVYNLPFNNRSAISNFWQGYILCISIIPPPPLYWDSFFFPDE